MQKLIFKNKQLICLSCKKITRKNVDEIDPMLQLFTMKSKDSNGCREICLGGARYLTKQNFKVALAGGATLS